jgi:hypothetical protein
MQDTKAARRIDPGQLVTAVERLLTMDRLDAHRGVSNYTGLFVGKAGNVRGAHTPVPGHVEKCGNFDTGKRSCHYRKQLNMLWRAGLAL